MRMLGSLVALVRCKLRLVGRIVPLTASSPKWHTAGHFCNTPVVHLKPRPEKCQVDWLPFLPLLLLLKQWSQVTSPYGLKRQLIQTSRNLIEIYEVARFSVFVPEGNSRCLLPGTSVNSVAKNSPGLFDRSTLRLHLDQSCVSSRWVASDPKMSTRNLLDCQEQPRLQEAYFVCTTTPSRYVPCRGGFPTAEPMRGAGAIASPIELQQNRQNIITLAQSDKRQHVEVIT